MLVDYLLAIVESELYVSSLRRPEYAKEPSMTSHGKCQLEVLTSERTMSEAGICGGSKVVLWLIVLIVVGSRPVSVEWARGAGPPRALPVGETPADTRLGPLKGERGNFSFVPARSPQQWSERAQYVRRAMLVTLGLWPMPSRSPLNPVIHGLTDQGDYTIEKVYFESVPGFYAVSYTHLTLPTN